MTTLFVLQHLLKVHIMLAVLYFQKTLREESHAFDILVTKNIYSRL